MDEFYYINTYVKNAKYSLLTMQIKQGQLEQHTQSFFLNGILTQLMSLTQGFGPPPCRLKQH